MNYRDLGLIILNTAIWGFVYVVIKVGLHDFPPLFFACLRYTAVAFPAIFLISRGNIPWRWIFIIGSLMGVIQYSLLYIGMAQGMPAGLSSLMLQSQAIFTPFLSSLILKDAPTKWQKIGIFLSFLGIGLFGFDSFGKARFLGLSLILLASIAWALGNICLKFANISNGFRLFVWSGIVPPIPLLILSLIFEKGQLEAISHITWLETTGILYTGWISTIIGYGIWAYLIQKYSPNVIAPFSLLVPVFGLFFSTILLKDTLDIPELIGSLLIFLGILMTVAGKEKAAKFKYQKQVIKKIRQS